MLQFQNIEFLLGLAALIPLVVLFVFVLRRKQRIKQSLGDIALINKLTDNYSNKKYIFKVIAVLAAITLLIVTAANLRKPDKVTGSAGAGIDVIFALDISRSMLSQDEKPTRLDKAKQLIYQLTQQLDGNRIGLVVFAGQAYLQMPLTPDAAATKMYVSNASPDLVNIQGTNISDALRLSDASLDIKEKKYKTIVLITDGEDHENNAVETAKQLAEHGTILYTVGIGSPEGVPIPEEGSNDYKKDANGQTVISKLNEQLLQQLAATANGDYHRLTDIPEVSNSLLKELSSMDKKALSAAGSNIEYSSFYMFFLFPGILLLILEAFITERKRKKLEN